jgi:hypothetical protein
MNPLPFELVPLLILCYLFGLGVRFILCDTDIIPKLAWMRNKEGGDPWDHARFDAHLQELLARAMVAKDKRGEKLWYGVYKLWTCTKCQSTWAGFLSALIYTVLATPSQAWLMTLITFILVWPALAWSSWMALAKRR